MTQQTEFEYQRTEHIFNIDTILIGRRHREDVGDLTDLCQSITELGQLMPILITPERYLVTGLRRLAAMRKLELKRIKVIVCSDLSDPARALAAERDEELCRKQYNPVEQASLFREYRKVLAAEAAAAQALTQFACGPDNPRWQYRSVDGFGYNPKPSHQGKRTFNSRDEAAAMVGGLNGRALERINKIQDIADQAQGEVLGDLAGEALTQIAGGNAPIDRTYAGIKKLAELEAIASDEDASDYARDEAASALELIRSMGPLTASGIERIVGSTINRIDRKDNCNKAKDTDNKVTAAEVKKKPAKDFVHIWGRLDGWSRHYDVAEIAAEVPEDKWTAFVQTTRDAIEFIDTVNAHRARLTIPE